MRERERETFFSFVFFFSMMNRWSTHTHTDGRTDGRTDELKSNNKTRNRKRGGEEEDEEFLHRIPSSIRGRENARSSSPVRLSSSSSSFDCLSARVCVVVEKVTHSFVHRRGTSIITVPFICLPLSASLSLSRSLLSSPLLKCLPFCFIHTFVCV